MTIVRLGQLFDCTEGVGALVAESAGGACCISMMYHLVWPAAVSASAANCPWLRRRARPGPITSHITLPATAAHARRRERPPFINLRRRFLDQSLELGLHSESGKSTPNLGVLCLIRTEISDRLTGINADPDTRQRSA